MDIGVGIVIHGNTTRTPIIESLIYQQIHGIALSFDLAPLDFKFFK